jgi:hypothetical protein
VAQPPASRRGGNDSREGNQKRKTDSHGTADEVTQRELPVSTTLAGVDMRLKPGAIRELHWHKEAEWAYMLAGSARVTAIDPERPQLRRRSRSPARPVRRDARDRASSRREMLRQRASAEFDPHPASRCAPVCS